MENNSAATTVLKKLNPWPTRGSFCFDICHLVKICIHNFIVLLTILDLRCLNQCIMAVFNQTQELSCRILIMRYCINVFFFLLKLNYFGSKTIFNTDLTR